MAQRIGDSGFEDTLSGGGYSPLQKPVQVKEFSREHIEADLNRIRRYVSGHTFESDKLRIIEILSRGKDYSAELNALHEKLYRGKSLEDYLTKGPFRAFEGEAANFVRKLFKSGIDIEKFGDIILGRDPESFRQKEGAKATAYVLAATPAERMPELERYYETHKMPDDPTLFRAVWLDAGFIANKSRPHFDAALGMMHITREGENPRFAYAGYENIVRR